MLNNKNDPLVDSIRSIMIETDKRRRLEEKLNSELGITSRKALPNEDVAEYDRTLTSMINEEPISAPIKRGPVNRAGVSMVKPQPIPAPAVAANPNLAPTIPVGQKPGIIGGALSFLDRMKNAAKVTPTPGTSISPIPQNQGPNPVPGPAVKPITTNASPAPVAKPIKPSPVATAASAVQSPITNPVPGIAMQSGNPTVKPPPAAAQAPVTPETNSVPTETAAKPNVAKPAASEPSTAKKTVKDIRAEKIAKNPVLPWGHSQETRDKIFSPDTGN